MKYEKIEPPEHLRSYIKYFWKLESDAEDKSPKSFKIFADGSPGIIINRDENGSFYQNSKKMPGICLYGQSTQFAELRSEGDFNAVGVFLRPNSLSTVFGLNASEITNSCLDLELFNKDFSLAQRLQDVFSIKEKIGVLSSFLFSQIHKTKTPDDEKIDYALTEITSSHGNLSLKDLQEDLMISEKSLQRNFKRHVGVTPKIYSRICQFQASLIQLRNSNFTRLSDIAYDNEYADQSHFIRSFRKFSGLSPNQFQKQSEEVLDNLTKINS